MRRPPISPLRRHLGPPVLVAAVLAAALALGAPAPAHAADPTTNLAITSFSDGRTALFPGERTTYVARFRNAAVTSSIKGYRLDVAIPAGATLVSAAVWAVGALLLTLMLKVAVPVVFGGLRLHGRAPEGSP